MPDFDNRKYVKMSNMYVNKSMCNQTNKKNIGGRISKKSN